MSDLEDPPLDPADRWPRALRQALARSSGGLVLAVGFAGLFLWFAASSPAANAGVAAAMGVGLGLYFGFALGALSVIEAYLPEPPWDALRWPALCLILLAAASLLVLGILIQIDVTESVFRKDLEFAEAPQLALKKLEQFLDSPRKLVVLANIGLPLTLQVIFSRHGWRAWIMPLLAPLPPVVYVAWNSGIYSWLWQPYLLVFGYAWAVVLARWFGDWVEQRWIRWREAAA